MGDVFDKFKEYSVAEFFKKNRQMLGFSGKVRSLTTIVHEYITNSLDSCEEHGILPDIRVEIKELENGNLRTKVQDNGTGIPEKLIGKALGQMLAGTKFARYAQQRGQQGIGATGCTMYALLTTGKPIYVESRYKEAIVKCNLAIDFKSNSPVITNLVKEPNADGTGLVIEAEFSDVKYDSGAYGVYEYLRRTALANPHAQITLVEPGGNSVTFPRSDERIPPKPRDVLPHPLGITTHDLIDFSKRVNEGTLNQFLQDSFSRVSANKVSDIRALAPEINFGRKPKDLSWEEADKLVKVFKQVKWIAPATDSVVPIGKEQIEKAVKNILVPEFMAVTERSPKVFRGGIPFLVEAAIAYGGNSGHEKTEGGRAGDIMRFANRVPLLFDAGGCGITEAVKNIDWKRYGIKDFDNSAITVFINFTSVHVPYTGAGKQAISTDEEIMDEIRNAVQEAARLMQRYVGSVVREREREGKKKAVFRYIEQLSKDLGELSGTKSEELGKKLVEIVERKYANESNGENGNGEEKKEKLEEPEVPEE
ncbi:MAG: DNA topoisomerase VI subunit B [Candidatus Micrarchaeia archaeon]